MRTVQNIHDLQEYGVICLTGESCAHMHRVLFDLTAKGKAIIERVMDVQLTLHDSWNHNSADPHVGSILLPYEYTPTIAVFALLSCSDVTEAWLMKNGTVFGFGVEDVDQKEALRIHHEGRITRVFYATSQDRNLHVFSGRTA